MTNPESGVLDETHALDFETARREAAARAEAEHNAHPHTQLTALIADLNAPRHDLHDRLGAIHHGLIRLAQLVRTHTPAPEKSDGEG